MIDKTSPARVATAGNKVYSQIMTTTQHTKSIAHWTRALAGSETAISTWRKIEASLTELAKSDPAEMAARHGGILTEEIRRAQEMIREYEADLEDVMEQIVLDGYTPDDFDA